MNPTVCCHFRLTNQIGRLPCQISTFVGRRLSLRNLNFSTHSRFSLSTMVLFALSLSKWHNYSPLPSDNSSKRPSASSSVGSSFRNVLLKMTLICLLIISGFFAGRFSISTSIAEREDAFGFATSNHLFEYNRTFGEAPSNATNAAWESLFPKHGGFFVHPELAPKRSAFSVFHQMHCLDELRHGFYVLHEQVIAYSDMIGDRQAGSRSHWTGRAPQAHSLGHIRHCIDLLRQSLMCNADLTVELKNEELGGVTGFGTVHRCVNWPALLEWIRPYEETDSPPIPQEHDHTG
ncbi:hypothetical protein F4777DRAFT_484898 [Nemania sp. FL0916]|nr:hypothetical protein F4777DRAFT_484898 [Nemania sp. FL0916]